jgi:hypothetical protein
MHIPLSVRSESILEKQEKCVGSALYAKVIDLANRSWEKPIRVVLVGSEGWEFE